MLLPNSMPVDATRSGGVFAAWLLPRVALVLALLAAIEAVTRLVLVPASNDFRSFSAYAARAAALAAAPGLRIAVVGNSTARSGVDGELLQTLLTTALDRPVAASLFVADSSEVKTWRFMLRRYFWRPRLRPDEVVMLYYGDGLFDSRVPEIGRLAQFFTTTDDIPELFRDALPELGQQIDYLVSSSWMTYAARHRLRDRILGAIVPDYVSYVRRLNGWHFARRTVAPATKPTFSNLGHLLADARSNGTRVVVVAVPTAPTHRYEVPDALVAAVEGAGMTFLDHRFTPALTPALFPDGLHLSAEGKAIYTRLLADGLSRIFAAEPGSTGASRP